MMPAPSPVRIIAALVAALGSTGSTIVAGICAWRAAAVGDGMVATGATVWCLGSLLSLAFIIEWGR